MKRKFLAFLLLALLLSSLMAALPAGAAADNAWRKITYVVAPQNEGEQPITGEVTTKGVIPGSCTLSFDASKTGLTVNGVAAENGVALTTAGIYHLGLTNLAQPQQKLTVEITVMPDINVADGQVFTTYPTVICSNASERGMEYQRDLNEPKPFASGTQIRELGRHTLTVYGKDPDGYDIKFAYVFYVKACDAVRLKDPATGKEALDMIVGSFDDMTVEATLNGEALAPGSNIVTKVGEHKLSVKLNGAEVTQPFAAPDAAQTALRIALYVDSFEEKEPYHFDFSDWDATVLLDGKPVSGKVRIEGYGTHELTVVDENGKTVEGAFLVTVGDAELPAVITNLKVTFKNPHLIYAIIAAVPAVAFLVAACYFFLARRRLV